MQQIPTEVNRRQFLGRSACNAAGLAAGFVGLSATAGVPTVKETVRVGIVGVRRQGRKLSLAFAAQPNTLVQALCDIDGVVLDRAASELAAMGVPPQTTGDYRQLLDDPRIGAIVIATPDHSHASIAIEALAAGKDVYLESPVCHTIAEGEALTAAVRRSGRILQSGLFDRSLPHVVQAIELVRQGRIGSVPLAKAWAVHRRISPTSSTAPTEAPTRTDYAGWLAPAPERPFDPQRFHRNWNSFWDFGSGELGTWGTPLLDLAVWGLDVELPERVSASGSLLDGPTEIPDCLNVAYTYPQATITWEHRQWSNHPPEGRSAGVAFYGTDGTLILDRGGWKIYDAADAIGENGRADISLHVADFLDAVRSRREALCPIETGVRAAGLCHLGNIAYRLKREVRYDAVLGQFANDDTANALLTQSYRPGFAFC